MPFFGEYEYVTADNGPIWILGSAVFYDYVVEYAACLDFSVGVPAGKQENRERERETFGHFGSFVVPR